MKNLAFWRRMEIPQRIPPEIEEIVLKVKSQPTRQAALECAHSQLSKRYRGFRGQTYIRILQLFRDSSSVLNTEPGFLHCTHMNYLLLVTLVKSGWFKESDIRFRWTNVFGISPHQYAQVKIESKWIDVDIWGASYGIELGDHSHWFHAGRLW